MTDFFASLLTGRISEAVQRWPTEPNEREGMFELSVGFSRAIPAYPSSIISVTSSPVLRSSNSSIGAVEAVDIGEAGLSRVDYGGENGDEDTTRCAGGEKNPEEHCLSSQSGDIDPAVFTERVACG